MEYTRSKLGDFVLSERYINEVNLFKPEAAKNCGFYVPKHSKIRPQITQRNFVFDHIPTSEAFETMEKVGGIQLQYNKESMKDCFLTALLSAESIMWECSKSFNINVVISNSDC